MRCWTSNEDHQHKYIIYITWQAKCPHTHMIWPMFKATVQHTITLSDTIGCRFAHQGYSCYIRPRMMVKLSHWILYTLPIDQFTQLDIFTTVQSLESDDMTLSRQKLCDIRQEQAGTFKLLILFWFYILCKTTNCNFKDSFNSKSIIMQLEPVVESSYQLFLRTV